MRKNKRNIVLIGMMGCGKSTIGIALSYKLHMPFVDLDNWLEHRTGRAIKDIFAEDGEAGFRELEHQIVEEVSAWKGFIISTGGGVVLREDNMELLSKNALVIFINRPVEDIVKRVNTQKRPLLAGPDGKQRLFRLKEERYPLYRQYADMEVVNRGSFHEGVQNVYRAVRRNLYAGRKRQHNA